MSRVFFAHYSGTVDTLLWLLDYLFYGYLIRIICSSKKRLCKEVKIDQTLVSFMVSLERFKLMIKNLDQDVLATLCEQFVYDHEGAINATIRFAADFGISIEPKVVKGFITEMHKNGDFDHVECWGLELGSNDLYKKFHP